MSHSSWQRRSPKRRQAASAPATPCQNRLCQLPRRPHSGAVPFWSSGEGRRSAGASSCGAPAGGITRLSSQCVGSNAPTIVAVQEWCRRGKYTPPSRRPPNQLHQQAMQNRIRNEVERSNASDSRHNSHLFETQQEQHWPQAIRKLGRQDQRAERSFWRKLLRCHRQCKVPQKHSPAL